MDLAELRRRAYSRNGTPADLRALAAAESRDTPTAEPTSDPSPDTTPDTTPTPDAGPTPDRPGRTRLRVAVAGAAGLLVGVLIGAAVVGAQHPLLLAEPDAARPSSLTVFERADARPPDAVALTGFEEAGFDSIETRFLQQVDGGSVYAVRAESPVVQYAVSPGGVVATHPAVETAVCLVYAHPARGDAWACTNLDDFARSGLENSSGDLVFGWGPTGDTLRVTVGVA